MKHDEFQAVLNEQFEQSRLVLAGKAEEYATDVDRLSNFKKAGHLEGKSPSQAVHGMMVKHVVSIADMVASGNSYTKAEWDEKIGDNLNYLVLLKAALIEDGLCVIPPIKTSRRKSK